MVSQALSIRLLELQRRSEALPKEVTEWIDRTKNQVDYNAHYSQLQAIEIMMNTVISKQQQLLKELDSVSATEQFQRTMFELIKEIIKAQRVWDFFRDKLEMRFSPDFKGPLAISDTVAWDCYRSTLENARELGIISQDHFREPPLTYLTAEFSPATWVRGDRPNDGRDYLLGTSKLPIPVIEIPWDHVVNVWEFLSIHHEVGHDIEADLSLRPVLLNSLARQLRKEGVPESRIRVWKLWEGEIFADLVGLLLAGPAFASSIMNLLLLPRDDVINYSEEDPHPTHYIRIFLNTAFIRTMLPGNQTLVDDAQNLDRRWTELYGSVSQLGIHKVDDLKSDFTFVLNALIDTKFDDLKGHSIREIIPFSENDYALIRASSRYLVTGQNQPANIPPRYIISASRLAVDEIIAKPGNHALELDALNKRTVELVNANTPEGLRAVSDSGAHRRFIESLSEAL